MGIFSADSLTAIAAVIAAISSTWAVILQHRVKRDCILVKFGTVVPEITEQTFISVVNQSDHQVVIADCGFIEKNGSFSSLRLEWDIGELVSEQIETRGDLILPGYGEKYEIGIIRRECPIGVYAMTNTQTKPTISFSDGSSLLDRLKVRVKLFFDKYYLSH